MKRKSVKAWAVVAPVKELWAVFHEDGRLLSTTKTVHETWVLTDRGYTALKFVPANPARDAVYRAAVRYVAGGGNDDDYSRLAHVVSRATKGKGFV